MQLTINIATENSTVVNAQQFKIQVDQQQLVILDPVPTGRQILDTARKRPVDEFLVFYLLPSGQLEEIRLDETVDLRAVGVERFMTFRSDRSFRLTIDGRRFEWGINVITGFQLKKLAQVDPKTYGVWLEVRGEADRPVGNKETVNLDEPGVERFFTGKKTTTEG